MAFDWSVKSHLPTTTVYRSILDDGKLFFYRHSVYLSLGPGFRQVEDKIDLPYWDVALL